MKVVGGIRYSALMLLPCLLTMLSGCGFREVLDDYPVSGVRIVLDWVDVAENLPKTMRVIFYPKDTEGRKVEGYADCRRRKESAARQLCGGSL